MSTKHNPHDKFFKEIQSIKENATDFIRGTFPKELVERLYLDSLSLETNSYITEDLAEYFSDVVYSCDYRSDNVKKGLKLKISLLFEHKSYPVKYPHLQLLRYMLGIWEKQIKSGLGIVIPIIFYHGKKGWKKRGLKSYFKGLDPLLETYIPEFDYLLIDLKGYDLETIRDKLFKLDTNKIAYQLFRLAFEPQMLDNLIKEILTTGRFHLDEGSEIQLAILFSYILSITRIKPERLARIANQVSSRGGKLVMTTYEQILKEGEIKGRTKGIAEGERRGELRGIIKGERKGKLKTARAMLKRGLDPKLVTEITGLSIEEIKSSPKA